MDKSFTFRFYDVTRSNDQSPAMVDVLREVAAIDERAAREKQLAQDYTIRLENFEEHGANAVVGELTRCQNTNMPSAITGSDRTALDVERLGHSIVFRLNHVMGVLGIQYDPRIVSPGRLIEYLAQFNHASFFRIDPRINQEAWRKFNDGRTRKLRVRINNPDDMGNLDGAGRAASDSFRAMGDAYDAPSVYIEMSMGHKRGFLSEAVSGLANQLSRMNFPGVRLDKLSAVTVVDDASEEIDLIEDRVVAKDTLAIDDRDPDENWSIKRDYLCRVMQEMIG